MFMPFIELKRMGIDHFVENHFIKSQKSDQKISG